MPLADNTAFNAASLLISGATLALVTSYISEKRFASPTAQLLPYAKYVTILGYVLLERAFGRSQRKKLSRTGTRLIRTIGGLSVLAYCLFCAGFALAGTGLAVGMHAATGQTFTALFSRVLLKRKLSSVQIAAVVVVNVGLLLRSLAPDKQGAGGLGKRSFLDGVSASQAIGGGAIIGSSICYALLGVQFDHMLKVEQPSPPYSQVMEVEGWIGIGTLSLWQLFYTIPNWDTIISKPLQNSNTTATNATILLLLSGIIFIWHYYNMTNVFRTDGAIVVGLINAVRGAVVSLAAGWMLCSPARPDQCNSFWTVASALVVTLGAVLWVLDKQTAQKQKGS